MCNSSKLLGMLEITKKFSMLFKFYERLLNLMPFFLSEKYENCKKVLTVSFFTIFFSPSLSKQLMQPFLDQIPKYIYQITHKISKMCIRPLSTFRKNGILERFFCVTNNTGMSKVKHKIPKNVFWTIIWKIEWLQNVC